MRYYRSRFALILSLLLIVGALAFVAHFYIITKTAPNSQAHQPYTGVLTARSYGDTGISISRPYGLDGRNIKHAGQMANFMANSISDHMLAMADQCDKLDVNRSLRAELIKQTYKAGKDAMDRVVASNYMSPFQPNYPPLPK